MPGYKGMIRPKHAEYNSAGHGLSEDTYGHIDEDVINHLEPIFNEYEDCMELHRDEEDIGSCMECLKRKIYRVFSREETKEAKEFIRMHFHMRKR